MTTLLGGTFRLTLRLPGGTPLRGLVLWLAGLLWLCGLPRLGGLSAAGTGLVAGFFFFDGRLAARLAFVFGQCSRALAGLRRLSCLRGLAGLSRLSGLGGLAVAGGLASGAAGGTVFR